MVLQVVFPNSIFVSSLHNHQKNQNQYTNPDYRHPQNTYMGNFPCQKHGSRAIRTTDHRYGGSVFAEKRHGRADDIFEIPDYLRHLLFSFPVSSRCLFPAYFTLTSPDNTFL